ncbi:pentatricopeptide repeat-containing protein At1g26460, mitochondrial [Beta vulgaris subsp. vulgaris]|uniref:pentatricopeptide repeat-containing protein At1g26460, mitochondrial n=1 Tax=Beta vulgaris subsp. vulgaris TaxID=3555 RepID=UPI0020375102|nr:pentatricopeptide repeat-containing protein At1g26460, mitochondrial [Beta vulgaris subsp. vulgaris]
MQSKMAILSKSRALLKTLNPNSIKSITTFSLLNQEPQLAEPPSTPAPTPSPSPLPPNPSSGSPMYNENWRSPIQHTGQHSLIPTGFLYQNPSQMQLLAQKKDANSLMNLFADWMTSRRWADVKQVFESWIKTLDVNGKPNKPNVQLFNHYLRAHFMDGTSARELLDVVCLMEEFAIEPNTASFNLVLKAMQRAREADAAEKLLQRMLHGGKESQPDAESYDLVISMLFQQGQIDMALKYIELTLKSGYMLSTKVFVDCVQSCINQQRLESLVMVIEKCKAMDQNKALSPSWSLCNDLANVAIQNDNSKLTFLALGFMARLIQVGENARPPIYHSVDEGLVISALATAARTSDTTLLDASWAILKRSLREKRVPKPETYLAKINTLASLGSLPSAFNTLNELERTHASYAAADEDLLSPFTSLYPLVVACSKQGFETLDLVYFQLENLSRADPPFKSVAAMNCVILGCANIWDLDRAYQTFEAISSTFGLNPNIHSYNALMSAFGKLKKTFEATRVFEHLCGLGVKPNATSYSLLVDAHLINRDPKTALTVLNTMVEAGFEPSKETLKKVRRRCVREVDQESYDHVESLARKCKIFLGTENRRNMLFNLEYGTEYAS